MLPIGGNKRGALNQLMDVWQMVDAWKWQKTFEIEI